MKGIERWSHPTWNLLHTLVEKTKPESFLKIKGKLFWIFRNICNTLPCPDCRGHAVKFVKTIKFKNIKNKDQLKYVIFVFHNNVNERLRKPKYTIEQLNKTYSEKNTYLVIKKFMSDYSQNGAGNRDMANSMARNILLRNMGTWFRKNLHHFD